MPKTSGLQRVLLAAALCASLPTFAPAVAHATDWPTYGFDTTRQGFNPAETTISKANVGKLVSAWTLNLATFDQKLGLDPSPVIEAQPVVASGLAIAGGTQDVLYVGDTDGVFFALDAPTGHVRWFKQLGHVKVSGCIDFPGGLYGIIGSAVIDRAANNGRGAVYVASTSGTVTQATTSVSAFDLVSGTSLAGWPIAIPDISAGHEGYVYGGLTLWHNQLYVPTAAACSEQTYHGQIALFDTAKNTFVRHWYTEGGGPTKPTTLGGGIWGPGGVTIDPKDPVPGVYAGTGNSLPYGSGEQVAYAEAIVKISLDLTRTLDSVSPQFSQYNDEDFGSTPVLLKPPVSGCNGHTLAVALNKVGLLLGYSEDRLKAGAAVSVQISGRNGHLLGDIAYDPVQNILIAGNPTTANGYAAGVLAFKFNTACQLTRLWSQTKDDTGGVLVGNSLYVSPPTIANGVVYIGTAGSYAGAGKSAPPARVVAFDEATGKPLWHGDVPGGALSAPMVVNGLLFEGGFDHVMHAWKLPGT